MPGLRGQQSEADPLDRFDAVLDLGVITVEGVDEPHLPGAGHTGKPMVGGDVRGDDLVAPAGALLEGRQLLRIPPRGLDPAHDQPHPCRPAGQIARPGQLGDLVGQPLAVGSLDLVDLAVLPQRGRPHVLGQQRDGLLVRGVDGPAGHPAHPAPAGGQGLEVVEDVVAEGRAVDPDQQLRPQRQRELPQRGGQNALVVGDVVGRRVAGPQQQGDALAGVGHPRPQRHVAEAALESARRAFLPAGTGDDGRVQVQDIPAGHLPATYRDPGEAAGAQGEQRPHHAAYRGAGALHPRRDRAVNRGQGAAQGAVRDRPRKHRPPVVLELFGLQDVPRADHDRTGQLDQRHAPIPPARPGAPGQRRTQRGGQAGAVGNLSQQHHARVADQVLAVGPHGKPMIPFGSLHLLGASSLRRF
jgi:hypothetical protein